MGVGDFTSHGPYTTPAALKAGMEGAGASLTDEIWVITDAGLQWWFIQKEGS